MTFILGSAYTVAAPLIFVGFAACVMFSEGPVTDGGSHDDDNDKTLTVSSMVKSCLAGADPFLPCINERAMAAIEQTESMDAVRLDPGLEIFKQPGPEAFAPRGVYTFGDNPYNIGAVVEAASSLLSRRTFCWDMSALYPGLQMRIGPTFNGRGMIDFVVDQRKQLDERSFGYGHMIFKRSFLPNLLTTQISVATVIPLIFAALYFLTKKAFLLSKFALIITSVVGYGSLFLQHSGKPFGHSFGYRHPSYHPVADGHHHHHPIGGGPYNAFVGDIRGDKFTGDFNGFQQISSSASKPPSLFRGVNYFPQEDDHAAYKESADATKREAE